VSRGEVVSRALNTMGGGARWRPTAVVVAMRGPRLVAFVLALAGTLGVRDAFGAVVDGQRDPDYGAALGTQTLQSLLSDSHNGAVGYAEGSELNQAYGFISAGVLHVFLSGNLRSWILPTFPGPDSDNLELFIDTGAGGQHQLRADNAPVNELNAMAGLTFDTGFTASHWLNCLSPLGMLAPYALDAYHAELSAGGGGAGAYLGSTPAAGDGTLTGGANPSGILLAIDNRNTAGVGDACGPGDGTGVTTGIEWAIPLVALGSPGGCVRICAMVTGEHHGSASNQMLSPLPAGVCAAGATTTLDLGTFAGEQFFTVCPQSTPVSAATWGRLKATYR
jgi:hypothetical protein